MNDAQKILVKIIGLASIVATLGLAPSLSTAQSTNPPNPAITSSNLTQLAYYYRHGYYHRGGYYRRGYYRGGYYRTYYRGGYYNRGYYRNGYYRRGYCRNGYCHRGYYYRSSNESKGVYSSNWNNATASGYGPTSLS